MPSRIVSRYGGAVVERMRLIRILGRVWIPLVVLLVVVIWAFSVSRLHGMFGSGSGESYADSQAEEIQGFAPKRMTYEVFGPAGSVADISYFDVNAQPRQVDGAALPWSLTITTNSAVVVGNIVAQGDADSIGCRIVVDGEVKAERISNEVSAFTSCLLKGA